MDPEMLRQFRQRLGQQQTPAAPGTPGAPNTAPSDAKPADTDKKEGDKTAPPKPDTGPPPVTRAAAFEIPGNLADQRLTVDDKRMVSFNFQGAPWTFVLEEMAHASGMNLDWQQLPGDSLNLRSNTKYTVAQARDIVNEHLLARGYSMLVNAKVSTITVVNLDNMNTALVPRVAPEDLDRLQPHDLVKVSFRLVWMLAEQAAQEFKPVLSAKARLLALKTTNRLEAIDAVENLKQLAEILDEEQGQGAGDRLVKEFDLRYTRAPEILEQLEAFLGTKKESASTQSNAQAPQRQNFMQRMQQMTGQQSEPQPAAAPQQKPEVRLIANRRRNTILVNAPPDQMAIIKAAIYKLDVPPERSPVAGSGSQTMQVYRLATADPEVVVSFLDGMGDLDPQTKLEVDKKNRAVVAYANVRDHAAISDLVKNLDGSDRKLKVIQLHGLDASLVAGTLRGLLVGDDQTKTENNSNSSDFGPFGFGPRRGRGFGWSGPTPTATKEEASSGKFRVDADAVNNRLILWANKIELEQVEACLTELGEISPRERGRESIRFLDLGNSGEEQRFLERLRLVWPAMSKEGSKLFIDVPNKQPDKVPGQRGAAEPQSVEPPKAETAPKESSRPAPVNSHSAVSPAAARSPDSSATAENEMSGRISLPIQLTALRRPVEAADRVLASADANPAVLQARPAPRRTRRGGGTRRFDGSVTPGPAPVLPGVTATSDKQGQRPGEKSVPGEPVFITRSSDGRLVIASRDADALDALEKLAARFGPPRKDYSVFSLKYATAASVRYNLDDFFAPEKNTDSRRTASEGSNSDRRIASPGLSQRRPLRFLDDAQTNSILVQGASPEELRLIADLIEMYDRPEQPNAKASRMTKIFPILHSRASMIEETLKDVYRDLLSSNDKALESSNPDRNASRGQRVSFVDTSENEGRINQVRFKGQLSLGVDETSNRLLVSCPESLMQNIEKIVLELDHGAVPAEQAFQVLRIDRSIDASLVQKKLMDLLKKPSQKTEQPQPSGQSLPGLQQQQPQRQHGGRGQSPSGLSSERTTSSE
jgi:type II secretory pathway component GspD/PulD (secretin)